VIKLIKSGAAVKCDGTIKWEGVGLPLFLKRDLVSGVTAGLL